MKRLCFALILACAGLMSLNAATVSVLVIEAGLSPGTTKTRSASIWESGMMDAFFDAGHIVSNAPSIQVDEFSRSLTPEINMEFDEARVGGADFFVLIFLNHPKDDLDHVKDVIIQVFKVSTRELLFEFSEPSRAGLSTKEEFQNIKKTAGNILPRLKG